MGVFVFSGQVSTPSDNLTLFIRNESVPGLNSEYVALGEKDSDELTSAVESAVNTSGSTFSSGASLRSGIAKSPSFFRSDLRELDFLAQLPDVLSGLVDEFYEVGAWGVSLDIAESYAISGDSPLEIAGAEINGTLTAINQQEQEIFQTALCQEGQPYSILYPGQQLVVTLTGLSVPKNATMDLSGLASQSVEFYNQDVLNRGTCSDGTTGYDMNPVTIADLLAPSPDCPNATNGDSTPCFTIKAFVTTSKGKVQRERKDVTFIYPQSRL